MDEYERFKIKEYKYWSIYIHESQYYLGRTYIWSHRKGIVDFISDTNEAERKEFFEVANRLRAVLSFLFRPDLFNWATLGNITNQCHMHCVPRYKLPRIFTGITFEDKNWGRNWSPYDKGFKVSAETLMKIKGKIAESL